MFTNITRNKAFIAVYEEVIKNVTVRWVDHDGSVIKTETVVAGSTVTPPADPVREDYEFTGWNIGPTS